MSLVQSVLSQLPGNPLRGLEQADRRWQQLRAGELPLPAAVRSQPSPVESPQWDVIICGGTLGILLGAALAQAGWRVALLERGQLKGREQEWNISRQELQTFVELKLLSPEALETAIVTEYNPARVSFLGGSDLWVSDVLNVGVDPIYLLEQLKQRFIAAGGQLYEQTPFEAAEVHPNGVSVTAGERQFTARLLIDAMGHFSPIAQQARQAQRPEAVCLVVGTCAAGYPDNKTGDLITSFTPIRHQCQYFWEAFPAKDGRTTYLFTYVDAHPSRPSLQTLFEEYLTLLPEYQNVTLSQLAFKRALFGFFPAYRNSPLRYPWGRLLAVGDSSGSQSPLSFGGFGAMVRHLSRLAQGIDDALAQDLLSAAALGWLHPYQPNLSVTWLFQKAMSVGVDQQLPPNHINQLLNTIFTDMAALGKPVLKPFLQDVVQFGPLAKTLLRTSLQHPGLVTKILPQVGLPALFTWLRHYGGLAGYSLLDPLARAAEPISLQLPPAQQYYYQRWQEALHYGSGGDYDE
ncbi:MAG: FAD-binding oxidoreductase [Leptolyngbya sp. SIO4C1]|nr:FAD-binding oxidoreductase [Leptolyngbya sp. SIO4C1]